MKINLIQATFINLNVYHVEMKIQGTMEEHLKIDTKNMLTVSKNKKS
jgi:hypothetical protein